MTLADVQTSSSVPRKTSATAWGNSMRAVVCALPTAFTETPRVKMASSLTMYRSWRTLLSACLFPRYGPTLRLQQCLHGRHFAL